MEPIVKPVHATTISNESAVVTSAISLEMGYHGLPPLSRFYDHGALCSPWIANVLFLLPIILMYTGWSYWVFRGKVRGDVAYH